jgi:acetyl-CoA carboxylase carboxyltransferase component
MSIAVARRAESEVAVALKPRQRLEALCDPGSFRALRTAVVSARSGDRAIAGDGVLAGAGRVGGRPVFCYSEDPTFMGGSLGEEHAETIVGVMRLADRAGAPVIGFVESGGARLQEGHAALSGYGRVFAESVRLSGRVPQITVVTGVSAGGGAYSPALTDFVVMTERARMFLTGPQVVREALGEEVSMEELGGPDVHARNGVWSPATRPPPLTRCATCSPICPRRSVPRRRRDIRRTRRAIRQRRCRSRRARSTTSAR